MSAAKSEISTAYDYVRLLCNICVVRNGQLKHSTVFGQQPGQVTLLLLLFFLSLLPGHRRSNRSFSCPTSLTSRLLGKLQSRRRIKILGKFS